MDPKSIFQSRTFWANAFVVVVALFKHFGVDGHDATMDADTVAVMLGAVNIALRIATKAPVKLK